MLESIKQLYFVLDSKTRFHFAILLLPMLAITGLELISIGLVLPLIQVLVMENQEGPFIEIIATILPTMEPGQLNIWVTVLFVIAFLIKNVFLLLMIFLINLVVANKTATYGQKLFDRYMSLPLEFHFDNNSAAIMVNIRTGLGLTLDTVRVILMMSLDLMLMLGAFMILLFTQATAIITAAVSLGIIALVYHRFFSPIFSYWGQMNLELERDLVRWISQTFDSIRDVKILGAQQYLSSIIFNIGKHKYRYDCFSKTSIQIPRLLIETTIIVGFFGIFIFLKSTSENLTDLFYVLGLFGMASLRLMPSLNRFLTSAAELRRNAAYISTIFEMFSRSFEGTIPKIKKPLLNTMIFKKSIKLENVSYSYPNVKIPALKNINVNIERGQRIGFVGSSGAGKSTLMDLILGLLSPQSGRLLVDEQNVFDHLASWQSILGFVPQEVFLLDDTIRRNIAFGVPDEDIDDDQIIKTLNLAKLEDFVRELPQNISTVVGEKGTRLSGGQRQRIAIARALYHNPQVLVFDEATSSLDNVTEQKISHAIDSISREKTILIVAHRLSTVRFCDKLIFLSRGEVQAIGTYDQLIENNSNFRQLALVEGDNQQKFGTP